MGEAKYKKMLEKEMEISKKAMQERQAVKSELDMVGKAFVDVIKEKLNVSANYELSDLPPLPSDVAAGFTNSNVVLLAILVGPDERHEAIVERKLPILYCSFSEKGAYPCVINDNAAPLICNNFPELQKALLKICSNQGSAIAKTIGGILRPSDVKAEQQPAEPFHEVTTPATALSDSGNQSTESPDSAGGGGKSGGGL